MKNLIIILFVVSRSVSSAYSQSIDDLLQKYNANDIPYISVEELKMIKLKDSVLIMDAREKKEYNVSHIESAHFIGYDNFSVNEFSQNFSDKSAPIVVYCSVGIRSENISEKLKKAGYNNVRNLYGGIFAWKNKGYAVYDTNNHETEKVHTFSKHWSKYLKSGEKAY